MYHSYLEQFVVGSNEGVVTCDGVIGGMVITCFISEWCYMIKNWIVRQINASKLVIYK